MTLTRPMFPPPPRRSIPVTSLTPNQLHALLDLRRLRREAEAEVERLIGFLDMVDGYALSECEPSLGFAEPLLTGHEGQTGYGWPYYSNDAAQSLERAAGGVR